MISIRDSLEEIRSALGADRSELSQADAENIQQTLRRLRDLMWLAQRVLRKRGHILVPDLGTLNDKIERLFREIEEYLQEVDDGPSIHEAAKQLNGERVTGLIGRGLSVDTLDDAETLLFSV
jgi:hypothetical protein